MEGIAGNKTEMMRGEDHVRLSCCINREPKGYRATCLEVRVSAWGRTVREVLRNLASMLEVYFGHGAPVPRLAPAYIEFVDVPLKRRKI